MTTIDQVNFDKGSGNISRWQFDDIKISHAMTQFDEPSSFSSSVDDAVVRLHYGLRGEYDFSHKQLNQSFTSLAGRHNVMYSKGFDITVQNKSLELETFGIQFPAELFVQYTQHSNDQLKLFCESILRGESSLLSEQWPIIDMGMRRVIDEMRNCQYAGGMRKLFFLSKSLELLVLTAEAHQPKLSTRNRFIKNNADKDKIMAAHELVTQRIDNPPNLSELARAVGINEYKLKGGFKELFHTTVFGYIREYRLQLAQQYLRDSDQNAAEIANQLGYASPQHFNNAFKKRFGMTPRSLRKN